MTKRGKYIACSLALLTGICLFAAAASAGSLNSKNPSSTIVDFSPVSFPAKADARFFYSINEELKYSDQIDPQAPSLASGRIAHFLVSPDGNKIAAVIKGKLLIIGANSILAEVAKVDSITERSSQSDGSFSATMTFNGPGTRGPFIS